MGAISSHDREKHGLTQSLGWRRLPAWASLPLIIVVLARPSLAADTFRLQRQDVVAFLGGTNLINLQREGSLEAWLTLAYAAAKPRFRDLAWEGDTVFHQSTVSERWREEKFGGLRQQLSDHQVSVVFLQFGQNEVLTATADVAEFRRGYQLLLDAVAPQVRQVVIVTPTPLESPDPLLPSLSGRNEELGRYVAAMRQLAEAQRSCLWVDLFTSFHAVGTALTQNGIHVTPPRQHLIAREIVRQLGLSPEWTSLHESLRAPISQKHQLWRSYWRPANWKCLYGDDGQREFGKAADGGLTLREEWQQIPQLIHTAEMKIWEQAVRPQGKQ